MKNRLGGLLLAISVALGLMAFRKQAAPPDLSSPKATVRSFITAVQNRDVAAMQQCVKGGTNTDLLKQMFGSPATLAVDSVVTLVEEPEGDHVRVAAEFRLKLPSGSQGTKNQTATFVDMLTLTKQGEKWLLMMDPTLTPSSGGGSEGSPLLVMGQIRPFSFAVALASSPELVKIFENARNAARAASCTSNMKQIALGVMMYTQDYDELTPNKPAAYADQIFPYVKNRAVFTCPLDPAGTSSYTFNSGIAGVPLSAMADPAKTVMIYEGKDGKLNYKHDGQAVVGFMDGHCKLLKPEETAGLIWKVAAPKPAAKAKPTPTKKKGRK